ncbi:hypothetical protein WEI85_12785 [Actinomycetes bacterium KLBMP 9797]
MRIVRTMAAVLGLVAGAALVAPAQAQAAPSEAVSPVTSELVPVYDVTDDTSKLVSPAAAKSIIVNYWTAERLAAAAPAPTPVAQSGVASVAPESLGVPTTVAEPVAPVIPGGIRAQVAFSHLEGRVFFYNPVKRENQSCSGGTVNSAKKRLVITAGHCVHTGGSGGQWTQNWAFYPGYQNGTGPAGIFPLHQAWSNSRWTGSADVGYDYAVAITQNNTAGQRIVDRVGGNGLIVNPGRPFVTAIGYPSNFQNNEQQAFCQVQLTARSSTNRDQKLNCDMRFGASGSPWMRDYSDATTIGAIVSNQSYSLNADGSGPEYGPYYDNATAAVYNAAESASP